MSPDSYRDLLEKLETAIRLRNPQLAEWLLPGIPETKIRKILQRSKVCGIIDPIVSLYSWKNGVSGKPGVTMADVSLFPKARYTVSSLDLMSAYFRCFGESIPSRPEYA